MARKSMRAALVLSPEQPTRCSISSRLKRPPGRKARVDRDLHRDESLCVVTALGGTHFDHQMFLGLHDPFLPRNTAESNCNPSLGPSG